MRTSARFTVPILLAVALAAACSKAGDTDTKPVTKADKSAIVIVDDFIALDKDSKADVRDKDATGVDPNRPVQGNCAYTSIPANDTESIGAPHYALPENTAHGVVVANVLEKELTDHGIGEPTEANVSGYQLEPEWFDGKVHVWKKDNRELDVFRLEVRRYQTSVLIDRVSATVGALHSKGFTRVLLNLSFVVAPCDLTGWFTGNSEELAMKYFDLLGEDYKKLKQYFLDADKKPAKNDSNGWHAKVRLHLSGLTYLVGSTSDLYNDPAWIAFSAKNFDASDGVVIVAVAAAGNGVAQLDRNGKLIAYRQPHFPFAPGGWPHVLSVSASDAAGNLATYSNYGEVRVSGLTTVGDEEVKGTSFAAPRIVAQFGLFYLLGGLEGTSCDRTVPLLDYADATLPWPSPEPSPALFRNETRHEAGQRACTSLNQLVAP